MQAFAGQQSAVAGALTEDGSEVTATGDEDAVGSAQACPPTPDRQTRAAVGGTATPKKQIVDGDDLEKKLAQRRSWENEPTKAGTGSDAEPPAREECAAPTTDGPAASSTTLNSASTLCESAGSQDQVPSLPCTVVYA